MGKNRKSGSPANFAKVLRAKQDELRKRIEQQRTQMMNAHDPDDEAALAVWSVERELAIANIDRDTRTLSEVESALGSIEAGSYGTCVRCQEPISEPRLRALPWTRLCLECASGGVRPVPQRETVHPHVVSSSALQAALRARARLK